MKEAARKPLDYLHSKGFIQQQQKIIMPSPWFIFISAVVAGMGIFWRFFFCVWRILVGGGGEVGNQILGQKEKRFF